MSPKSLVLRLLPVCLLVVSSSLARSAEPAGFSDAALPREIAQLTPAEQREVDEMLRQPTTLTRYQPMEPEVGIAIGVFFADFSLRMAETVLVFIPFVPAMGAEGSSPATGYIAAASAISLGVIAMGPLLNAFVDQAIGNAGAYHRPFAPLVLTSYISTIVVDTLTILLAATMSDGSAAGLVYFFGSMAGSISMAIVQNAVREPIPEGTTAQARPQARGVAFAF
jgi:hypothetical protein